jgi:acetylornithine deacetylase
MIALRGFAGAPLVPYASGGVRAGDTEPHGESFTGRRRAGHDGNDTMAGSSTIDPVALLEAMVPVASHDAVDGMRELLHDVLPGVEDHESGCLVATKGSMADGDADGADADRADGPRVLLNTHMDTVPPHVEFEREGDVIRGRGSCDAKGSLAAMVAAFVGWNPEASDAVDGVRLVVSPDEETDSVGLHDYLDAEPVEADIAVVGEPTGLDVCTAARGRFEVEVGLHGEAAHAASGAGTSAIGCAAEAVRRLEALEPMEDDLLGPSRLTVTRISGGEAGNQVPAAAELFVDRRSVPPETQEQFLATVEETLADLDCDVSVAFGDRPTPFLEAFRTDEEEPVVERFRAAVSEATGADAATRPFDAACEGSYLAPHAPTVVFGPGAISEDGEAVAHSEREYVPVDEVRMAADALTRFLSG